MIILKLFIERFCDKYYDIIDSSRLKYNVLRKFT